MSEANPHLLYCSLLVLITSCNIAVCYKVTLMTEKATQHPDGQYPASLAVDTKKATTFDKCSHTGMGANAWWQIKLKGTYVVESVWLLNRIGAEDRLSEFNVSVGNISLPGKQTLCRYFSVTVPLGGSSITCDKRRVGSYVSVRKTTNRGGKYLSICETEVYGYRVCPSGYFNNDCRSCNCKVPCSLETGICPSTNCVAGWSEIDCQKACERTFWGENCVNKCMCKDTGEACNVTNGFCKSGCRDFLVGTGCNKQLPTVDSIRPTTLSSSSIAVAWNPSEAQGEDQLSATSYTMQYRPKEASTAWKNKTVGTDGTGTGPLLNHTVSGLLPNKTYVFRVVPKSMYVGVQYDGRPSQVSTGTKTSCEAPVAPSILKRDILCDSDGRPVKIDVSWENLGMDGHRCKSWHSLFVEYQVKSEDTPKEKNIPDIDATSTSLNFTTPKNVRFNLRMKVFNDENIANTSAWVMGIDTMNRCKGPSSGYLALIVGLVITLIIFVIVIVLGIFFILRQRRRHRDKKEADMAMTDQSNGGSVNKDDAKVEDVKTSHVNPSFKEQKEQPKVKKDHPAIPVEELEMYIEKAKATSGSFFEEFRDFGDGFTAPCTVADKPQNKKKNRFANIKAYDHSRVVLDVLEGDPHSDYINACYIDGYKGTKAYVASQGANRANVNDIWRLVWQVKANRIVMVTNLVEGGKRKCEQYWPERGSETFGVISATLLSTQQYADFVIRSFTLSRNGETHNVRQFHYTVWPDKDVPQYATSLLAFHRKVRTFDKTARGPLVVHCSAGVGRTGTFLALDYLLEQAKAEKQVNVYKCVEKLRKDRPNMVQTLVQYVFVYDALLEALRAGNTAIACSKFPEEFKDLCQPDSHGKTELQKQFQMLKSYVPKLSEEDKSTALKAENKAKNRDINVLPVGAARAHLSGRISGRNDYINAVYVHGHKMRNSYIATQAPLPDTVIDFWRLINEHHSSSIVMVNTLNEAKHCPRYWPEKEEKPMELGPLKIQCTEVDKSNSSFNIRKFKVTNAKSTEKEEQIVKHYELTTWPEAAPIPESADSVLELLENLERWQQQSSNRPITVHCLDGATRSGMVCVVSSVLEKMKIDQEVDVTHFVKKARIHRPQAIPNAEQFQFCHEAAIVYMDKFEQYANFK